MANRWILEETISARGLKAKSAGLAKRVERLIGSLTLCDSVQLWRDSQTDNTEPFVLFSLQQVAALRSLGATSTATTTVTGRSKAGSTAVEVSPRVVRTTTPAESTSALQRKLIERLTHEVPELAGCSSFAFERTRTKAADVPKWVATLTVADRSVLVGSLTPARELVKGKSLKLGFVGEVDGVKLVGARVDAIGHLTSRLVDLGLYTDELARALDDAICHRGAVSKKTS